MANLVKTCETTVKILDPGAGSGILSAAIMDKLTSISPFQDELAALRSRKGA